jgi:hypothetical protein
MRVTVLVVLMILLLLLLQLGYQRYLNRKSEGQAFSVQKLELADPEN